MEPALEQYERVIIDLGKGCSGGTSSFYDQSIGWLIREGIISQEEASTRIVIEGITEELWLVKPMLEVVIEEAKDDYNRGKRVDKREIAAPTR